MNRDQGLHLLAATWLALVAVSYGYAQSQLSAKQDVIRQLRYRVFDVGTFGGPNSETNGGTRVINNKGAVVGIADTSKPCPYRPGFVSPAFMWRDGVLSNIGLLPGGCGSLPNGISSNGIIAGSSENGKIDPLTGFPEIRADVRVSGRLLNLGTFGGTNSLSVDVNSHELVVGGAENKDPDPFDFGGAIVGGLPSPTAWRAFSWQRGKKRNLGTLGGPDSFAFFVNKNDEISGISFTNSLVNPITGFPTLAPFFWKDGKIKNIGSLGGEFGTMTALNNRSEVLGFSDLEGDLVAHAFVWAPGIGMKDLGTLAGTFSIANWINDSGEVVGGSLTANNDLFHAVRWRNGVVEDLGTAGGNSCSNAFQVNARGEIAGQSFNCDGTGVAHATLWEPTGSAIDLNVFLPTDSNLQLAESHFMNDHGEIVIVGILPSGDEHIIVFVPCSNESEDCRGANESRVEAQKVQTNGPAQARLTPEKWTALKSRLTLRHFGVPVARK